MVEHDRDDNISRRIAAALRVDSCAISLCGRPVQGSDLVAAGLEDWQFVLGEGPSHTATRTGQAVEHPDAASLAREHVHLAPHVQAAGIASVASFPIAMADQRLGAMTIYRSTPRRLRSWQRRGAEQATRTVAAAIRADPLGWVARRQLVTADFDLAVGYLVADSALDIDAATVLVRAHAYATDTPLRETCRSILHGDRCVLLGDGP